MLYGGVYELCNYFEVLLYCQISVIHMAFCYVCTHLSVSVRNAFCVFVFLSAGSHIVVHNGITFCVNIIIYLSVPLYSCIIFMHACVCVCLSVLFYVYVYISVCF